MGAYRKIRHRGRKRDKCCRNSGRAPQSTHTMLHMAQASAQKSVLVLVRPSVPALVQASVQTSAQKSVLELGRWSVPASVQTSVLALACDLP